MKASVKVEEFLMLALGVYLFTLLDISWWWFIGLFLAPDIGMLGYVFNARIGAITYNISHHKGIAIVLYLLGVYLQNNWIQLCGVILFSHSSFDRMLGYGLKYSDHFKNTHLGKIGKS